MEWVNAVIQGVLLGGLYALFATGLSLAFGVMRFVNLAHGDLAVLAAYLVLSTSATLGIGAWWSIAIVVVTHEMSVSISVPPAFVPRAVTRLQKTPATSGSSAVTVYARQKPPPRP